MEPKEHQKYRYRWVVLLVFSLITVAIEIQWLSFAPVAREARQYYSASAWEIDLMSMIYMGVFLIMCVPASYVIDTYGIRIGIGLGAALTLIFGLLKGVLAAHYLYVAIAQIGLAVAQPFIINASTKVAVRWFPINERATAVGLATLSQFVGIVIAMIVSPLLVTTDSQGNADLSGMLMIYGIVCAALAALLLLFLKERPPLPPGPESDTERYDVKKGVQHILRHRDMRIVLALFFIGLGVFNALGTCIDQLCESKGLTTEQTGLVGGLMLIAGIVGGIVLPPFSDRLHRRKAFIVAAMILMTPGLLGLAVFSSYPLLLASSTVLGFFLLGAGAPVGFQYAAEVSHPAPESTSQGIILLVGQISGIAFTAGVNFIGIPYSMMVFVALACVNVILAFALRESPMMKK